MPNGAFSLGLHCLPKYLLTSTCIQNEWGQFSRVVMFVGLCPHKAKSIK